MGNSTSSDAKITKMFKRLEQYLGESGLSEEAAVGLFHPGESKPFVVAALPERWESLLAQNRCLAMEVAFVDQLLSTAIETIRALEDESVLLDIIDAMNDVIQGRVLVDEAVAYGTEDLRPPTNGGDRDIFPFTSDVAAARGL